MLTPDCFKELCMLSRTHNAKAVRKYYISLERLIIKYNEYIKTGLESRINLLENNQKPKLNISGGVIYILDAQNTGSYQNLYKIGKTENIKTRLSSYNTGNANHVQPIFVMEVDDIVRVEKCIKNLVQRYQFRANKEIYQINLDLLRQAFHQCDQLFTGFENSAKKFKTDKEFSKQLERLERTPELILKIEPNK